MNDLNNFLAQMTPEELEEFDQFQAELAEEGMKARCEDEDSPHNRTEAERH